MKPKVEIQISTVDKKHATINALFDSGSFYSIIREDKLPSKKFIFPQSQIFGTAAKDGKVEISGSTHMVIEYEGRRINDSVLVSPNLNQEMIIGAGTMQLWHIDIENKKGKTKVIFRLDMRDPDIMEVD